ncbi:MAG: hypothetical protein HRT66_02095 [Flavobacteriaceae bacterium]|nr:hypothetical protein [Flavobacteriaceae bacterium]
MARKTYISLILLLSFLSSLGHSIVPHHHHDQLSVTSKDHHHKTDSKHDANHNNYSQNNHNESEPIGLFSHPTHSLSNSDFIFENSISQKKQTADKLLSPNIVIKNLLILTNSYSKATIYNSDLSTYNFNRSNYLRGPPSYLFS